MEQVETVVPATEALWAHPVAILALPAFIPVVVIVVTILWVARNDRRAEAAEAALESGGAAPASLPVGESPVAEERAVDVVATPEDPVPAEASEPRRPWRDRLPRLVVGDEE